MGKMLTKSLPQLGLRINLQKVLNGNPLTAVAVSGVGSPGAESSYFGNLTKKAVIKFQNLYASEILSPNGLSQGNGFVGPSTRAILNQLLLEVDGSVNKTQASSSAPITPASNPVSKVVNVATNSSKNGPNPPLILSINPQVSGLDDDVVITGTNFSPDSNIIFSFFGSTTVASDGTHLRV